VITRLVSLGSVIVDLVLSLPGLPERGGDVLAAQRGMAVGGASTSGRTGPARSETSSAPSWHAKASPRATFPTATSTPAGRSRSSSPTRNGLSSP